MVGLPAFAGGASQARWPRHLPEPRSMSLVSPPSLADAPVPAADPDLACPPTPTRRGEVDVDLALRHAGTRRLRLRYELVGDVRRPVVFVAGGISAHRHVAANGADAA